MHSEHITQVNYCLLQTFFSVDLFFWAKLSLAYEGVEIGREEFNKQTLRADKLIRTFFGIFPESVCIHFGYLAICGLTSPNNPKQSKQRLEGDFTFLPSPWCAQPAHFQIQTKNKKNPQPFPSIQFSLPGSVWVNFQADRCGPGVNRRGAQKHIN